MTFVDSIKRSVGRGPRTDTAEPAADVAPSVAGSASAVAAAPAVTAPAVEIAPTDPLFAYLQAASGVVDAERLELDSPALTELRAAHIRAIVPLVAQGELIGALYLGPRLSDQEYSADDRKLLTTLAAQAAPAIRVAQLVREQAVEIEARERLEQEMRVATLIQQQFLPRELPQLPDWQVAAYYGPARAVGGDFYDFIPLPDGRIGIVVGDVTDKGVPAALIMARTQSVLRGEAPRLLSPAKVLERANEILLPEMPARMFVTCLYMVLEPATGRVEFANAGHNLPYVRTADGVIELRATGMPLGPPRRDGLPRARGGPRPGRERPALQRRPRRGARPGRRHVRLSKAARADGHGTAGQRAPRPPPRRAPRVRRRGLGPGGRHHARRAPANRRVWPGRSRADGEPRRGSRDRRRNRRRAGPAPGHAARRAGQRAPGDGPRRRGRGRRRPGAGEAGAAQDRRQRGRDERDRVRQPVRSRASRSTSRSWSPAAT